MNGKEQADKAAEMLGLQLKECIYRLQQMGRNDIVLRSIGGVTLEQLMTEAAKAKLSQLTVTSDLRLMLGEQQIEVALSPIHRAVYLFFLLHPEGLEFKQLIDYRDELSQLYALTMPHLESAKREETVEHLTNPLDNAINEKCSRIRGAFMSLLDPYTASYYVISSHTTKHFNSSKRLWMKRTKIINLPRELVTYPETILKMYDNGIGKH